MTYSVEVKKDILNRILNGEYINKISDELGIGISTIRSWVDNEPSINGREFLIAVSKQINEMIGQNKSNEAMAICEEFKDAPVIQSQLAKILITQKQFSRVKEIAKKFPNHAPLQSQLVKILTKEGNVEEVKEICEKFPDHAPLQIQLVKILISLGKLDKAKEICERFPDDKNMKAQKQEILYMQSKLQKEETIGQFFSEEVTKISAQTKDAQERGLLKLIFQKGLTDLRAKMGFLTYLMKYGMNDVIEKKLKPEYEIYQEILRLTLFSKDNPGFNRNKLGRSKLVQDLKHKLRLLGVTLEDTEKIIARAMGKSEIENDLSK